MGLFRDRRRCLISAGFFHIREFSAPKWQKPEGNVKENRPFGENDKVRLTSAMDQGKIIISYLFGCSLLRKMDICSYWDSDRSLTDYGLSERERKWRCTGVLCTALILIPV